MTIKPLEARENLILIRSLTMAGHPYPPYLRIWFCGAIDQRLNGTRRSLDQLLGLSSRAGGRLHASSRLPQLHQAICNIAGDVGTPGQRARLLSQRVQKHRQVPDKELTLIEHKFGRMPQTERQLTRIILGETEAIRQMD